MNPKYTTGQFARMANVSLRTIRFYDTEGLLKPSFVGENGYRYYTNDDFLKLQQILSLKFLGFSLDQIRTIVFDKKEGFKESLVFQKKMIERRIDLLKSSVEMIDELQESVENNDDIDWNRIIDLVRLSNMEKAISEHYENSNNLDVRIALHERFSQNKTGWYPWLLSWIDFENAKRIFEIGCGDGSLWQNIDRSLIKGKEILLSDSSEGMIRDAKEKLGDGFEYRVIDAQKMDEDNGRFDCIIANHVLFYLSDIRYSLKKISEEMNLGGKFICSTYGKAHMHEVSKLVQEFDPRIRLSDVDLYERFGKENGKEILEKAFQKVEWKQYEDELVVTDTDALFSYVLSCHGNQVELLKDRLEEFRLFLKEKAAKDGFIRITKDAGCFICSK